MENELDQPVEHQEEKTEQPAGVYGARPLISSRVRAEISEGHRSRPESREERREEADGDRALPNI